MPGKADLAASALPKWSGPKVSSGPRRGIWILIGLWYLLLSWRAGFFCPGKRGNVCAPLPLPGVGEEAPRGGVRRGRFRPSRTSGAPGISQSHRTYSVLQEQLDHLFRLAEGASRGIEKNFGRARGISRKPRIDFWSGDVQIPEAWKHPLACAKVLRRLW